MGKSSRKPGSKAAVAHSKQQKTVIQKIAVNNAVKHFKSNARALITMACGSGKTRVGFMTIERMKKTISIIAVPTLGLVKQMRDDAASWPELSKHSQLLVCSSIRHGDVHERPEDYGLSVTTSPEVILNALRNASTRSRLLIVVTYQSFDKIAAAMQLAKKRKLNVELGMLVCDEAHNTAGDKTKKMSLCLSDKAAKISKRLFLTATPRVIGDRTKNPENHNCMDDVKVYGKNVYSLSFAEAIQKGITSDYEIRNMEVNWKGDAAKKLNSRSFQKSSSRVDELARYLAREMKKRPGMRVFSFHTDCASAEAFNAALVKCGVWSRCITGEMPVNDREVILGEFEANGNSRVICSVRVFGEGVDVPSVDTVVFTDPLTSEIQIAQMVGRGQRIEEGKSLLSVYLPIFHPMGVTSEVAEKTAKCSYFKTAIKVLRTLSSFDDRVVGEIRSKAEGTGSVDDKSSRTIFNQDGMSVEFAKVVNSLLLSKVSPWIPETLDEMVTAFRNYRHDRPYYTDGSEVVCGKNLTFWSRFLKRNYPVFRCTMLEVYKLAWPDSVVFSPSSPEELIEALSKCACDRPPVRDNEVVVCGRTMQSWSGYCYHSGWKMTIGEIADKAWEFTKKQSPSSPADLASILKNHFKTRPDLACWKTTVGGRTLNAWRKYIIKLGWDTTLENLVTSIFGEHKLRPQSLHVFARHIKQQFPVIPDLDNVSLVICGRTWCGWKGYIKRTFGASEADAIKAIWPDAIEFNPESIAETVTRLRKDHKYRPAFGEAPCGLTADKWEAIAKRLNTTVTAIMDKAFKTNS